MGVQTDDYVMVPDPQIRKLLHDLVFGCRGKKASHGHSISQKDASLIMTWIHTKQPELAPFIKLSYGTRDDATACAYLNKNCRRIVDVSFSTCS
jgi:hypothetical protein